jgi:hypothetical protein
MQQGYTATGDSTGEGVDSGPFETSGFPVSAEKKKEKR